MIFGIIAALILWYMYTVYIYNMGFDNGVSEGILDMTYELYRDKTITKAKIIEKLKLSDEEFIDIFETES